MKSAYRTAFLLFASLAVPAFATPHAAEGAAEHATHAEHGPTAGVLPSGPQAIVPMLVSIVVFVVVFLVLANKVWPVIVKGLKDREDKIREEIESAEMARQQAKDALEQYQQSLAQARAEAQKMLEQTRAQQAAMAAELKAKADKELAEMRDRAMRDIEAARRAAVAEIYSQQASLAAAIAGKILRREINSGDNQRLVEESLAQLA